MNRKAFINIKQLLQVETNTLKLKVSGEEMKTLPLINNAYLIVENDEIVDFGEMNNFQNNNTLTTIDCTGQIILPTWYDSHTHIVYAGNREQEFVDRINGLTYEEIANNGGVILNSAKKLQEISEEEYVCENSDSGSYTSEVFL